MNKEYTLERLQEKIGYSFKDESLLKQAMTHKSYTNEMLINRSKSYERLEFLGDAVLELVSSEFLFYKHDDCPEGELTKMRASMVCEPALAFCAKDLELGKYLLLGKGEESTGGRLRDSITSDAMEAVIGVLYIDGGMDTAREFVNKFVLSDLDKKRLFIDSKTMLQEFIQGKLKKSFAYRLVSETGPEHNKVFTVNVVLEGEIISSGTGRTKKSAEQEAAYEALLVFEARGMRK